MKVVWCALLLLLAPAAAGTGYMKIGSIEGESARAAGAADLESDAEWTLRIERPRGEPSISEVTMTKSLDKSSPEILKALNTGRAMPSMELGTDPAAPALRIELEDVYVSSYQVSSDSDDRPTEEVAFYYNKITFHYDAGIDSTIVFTGLA